MSLSYGIITVRIKKKGQDYMPDKRPPSRSTVMDHTANRFRELKADLAQIEYFAKGTVLARMVKCGKPHCACHDNPKKRHGPYFEWTYKIQGKTVNVRLTPESAPVFQAAAKQYKNLKSILTRMEKLSRQGLSKSVRQASRRARA